MANRGRGGVTEILKGFGLGLGVMYLADPDLGRRRRAMIRGSIIGMTNDLAGGLEDAIRDASNRLKGVAAETRAMFTEEEVPEMQTNWAPAARLAAGVLGGTLLANGLRRPSPLNLLVGALGFGLLARAATNVETRRLLGVGESRRGIDFQKTVNINAPLDYVYRTWTNYQTFPRFMRNVKEVRDLGGGRSAWTVAGPLGAPVRFNAVMTEQRPNEVFAWKSEEGEAIAHSGIVRFQPSPDGGTSVNIRMTYNPPAGAAGHLIASLFGTDPKTEMDEDLLRMKTFLETGRTPHDAAAKARP